MIDAGEASDLVREKRDKESDGKWYLERNKQNMEK